jgi:hypothetical protein
VIASTEGVGAIPSHIDQSYSEAKSALASAGQAIASVYRGGDPISDQKVEAMGRAAIPFTAGAVGGAGGSPRQGGPLFHLLLSRNGQCSIDFLDGFL